MSERTPEHMRAEAIEAFKVGLQQAKNYMTVGKDRSEITTGDDG